jgi:hypothetical protein
MPAEDISNSLKDLGFNIINVRQMMAAWTAPNGQIHMETLPLLLVTLTRNKKSQEIIKLNSLNHIMIRVELYRAQSELTQCYHCQNFDHVLANCRQPPQCVWCHGGQLHRECPEKTNTESTPSCCNCTLVEAEKHHSASYWSCSHAKGEEHNELPRDPQGGHSSLSSPQQSSPTQLCWVMTRNTSNHRHHRQMG